MGNTDSAVPTQNRAICAVVLAGGQGKRMKSDLPKPMFEVLDTPMLDWVLDACSQSGISDVCVVTGFNHGVIEAHLDGRCETVLQSERRGTGHAVMMTRKWLSRFPESDVLILNGDAPFIDCETILGALWQHRHKGNAVTVITASIDNPDGYGRILRSENGISGIIEDRDASPEQRKITEINSGAYWFDTKQLLYALDRIKSNNSQGEYYLTDSVFILLSAGFRADAYISANSNVVLGANDRKGLLLLNNTARFDIINRMMDEGVEFICTDGVTIGKNVCVGAGTKILQGVILKGKTEIGENCVVGPNCIIENCKIGSGVVLNSVQAYDSEVERGARIGPFVQLRPGSRIGAGVKIGNFVEIKNSTIGEDTSVSHLTYVGDSDVGCGVNFGCGVATANYDGENKYRTTIGNDAFIGCNTNLIAPVRIGNAAYTAAGSTITKDVPDGALAIERGEARVIHDYGTKRLKARIVKRTGKQ
ncbi:MAG: bifunctional UDP-N-acetylglucosamine diphosphorylase/glucosamine-1-phosphate N-acetyltransferase GlmU [Oscillospiraceae bacterium]|nr:bifunctional UDP-N-acetylglucosamine diphosphorylase/glucosamine-1-phosphate N-acetyltransferase GlmU [Oscillospiraceae bacterium]